jgi:hypothetical protein
MQDVEGDVADLDGVLRGSPPEEVSTWHINKSGSLETNGRVAYGLPICELVPSFTSAALRRRDKGKPAARRGRKAVGPALEESR